MQGIFQGGIKQFLKNTMEKKTVDQKKEHWASACRQLIDTLRSMEYPEEFGDAVAKGLGGEKAMRRMTSYLNQAKPRSAEEIVDEMLAIASEINAWRKKKETEYYNSKYNELLQDGLPSGLEWSIWDFSIKF